MKKVFLFALTLSLFTACGKGKSPKAMAEAYCNCNKKIMKMDAADPKRSEVVHDCSMKQVDARDAFDKDPERFKEYNRIVNECSLEMYNESQGK